MNKLLLCLVTCLAASELDAQVSLSATAGTTTGTYTTLMGAFDAINAGTHQGAITIDITADVTETATAVLNASIGTSNYSSVLVKPATGVNATISGASPVGIIKVNGGDNLTIEGSNNGTSSRNLTISNTFTAITGTSPAVVVITSTATDGSDNITVKNTNIAGSSSTGTIAGIIIAGSTLGAAEVSNNNFTAINNTIVRAQNGIFAIGNATVTAGGYIIKNNVIGSTVIADKMLFRGIALQHAQNFEISGNTITGVVLVPTSTAIASGILVGANVLNGNVFNNKISEVRSTNTAGYGAAGIYLNSANIASNISVYNNIVSGVAGYGYNGGGTVADNGNGIAISNGGGFKLYYNTIVMNVNQSVAGRPAALNISTPITAAGALDIRNNIFVNSQTQTGEKYVIYSAAPNTIFSNINNNNYFSSGTNLGYIGGAAKATLADIQTAFGGNTNSLNVLPVFVSTTDFHISNSGNAALDNKGTPIAGITLDADGNTRNATTPDLGAFEFTVESMAVNDVSKKKINLYPNPVVDYLYINNDGKIRNVEIYNISGQRVINEVVNAEKASVDMRKVPVGVYILKVNTERGSESTKVIKK
ncbi:Por secretion system C-terminal sorting domain-containing protein [Chryseobacterium ureilyticum]|uniref:Por secretion system C-terminal sorting domain-containing protein n=1 Tax=Chryseobacterium ureilyticum TaxID=373668 RepID=A0A1N7M676_9FLAO|nr:T9SS type A sorting domain-containing protein [Chryseobacterium ureilyticum]SIS81542.1 Por secretion system C-terminal sorting domain-containing protein [Chryseobacterium ureilyticum]